MILTCVWIEWNHSLDVHTPPLRPGRRGWQLALSWFSACFPPLQPRSLSALPGQLEGLPVPSLSFLSQGSRSLLCFLYVFSVVPLFLTLSPVFITSQSLELVSWALSYCQKPLTAPLSRWEGISRRNGLNSHGRCCRLPTQLELSLSFLLTGPQFCSGWSDKTLTSTPVVRYGQVR